MVAPADGSDPVNGDDPKMKKLQLIRNKTQHSLVTASYIILKIHLRVPHSCMSSKVSVSLYLECKLYHGRRLFGAKQFCKLLFILNTPIPLPDHICSITIYLIPLACLPAVVNLVELHGYTLHSNLGVSCQNDNFYNKVQWEGCLVVQLQMQFQPKDQQFQEKGNCCLQRQDSSARNLLPVMLQNQI